MLLILLRETHCTATVHTRVPARFPGFQAADWPAALPGPIRSRRTFTLSTASIFVERASRHLEKKEKQRH